MAGLRSVDDIGLRGNPDVESEAPGKLDDVVYKAGKIRAKPTDEKWARQIASVIQGGLVSRKAIDSFIEKNPNWAPFVESAYQSQQNANQARGIIGQYIAPGSPAVQGVPAKPEVPFETDQEQLFGQPGLRGNVAQFAQAAVPEKPAVAAKRDYQGAVDAFVNRGDFATAEELRKQGGIDKKGSLGELTIPKALAGTYGIKDMGDVVALSETAEGRAKLKEFVKDYQAYQPVTTVDEFGNVRTVHTPKLDAKGGSADSTLNKRVADLWGLVEKSRITAVAPAFKVLDKKMDEYERTGKVEGIGNLKNIKASDWVKTPEGRYMSSVVQLLENEELRQASGLAVTEPEAERKERADALKAANTADDYARVYKTMIRPRWNNLVSGLKASSGNDALDVLKKRGFDIDKLMAQETSKPANKSGWRIEKQ